MKTKKIKLKHIFGFFRQPEWELNLIVHALDVNHKRNALVVSYDMEAFMQEIKTNGLKTPLFVKHTNVESDMDQNLKEFEEINKEHYRETRERGMLYWSKSTIKNPAWEVEPNDSKKLHLRSPWLKIHREYKYHLIDGNHRAYALNKLYGNEYEVDVVITDASGGLLSPSDVKSSWNKPTKQNKFRNYFSI